MNTQAVAAQTVEDSGGIAWRFDSRGLTNAEDWGSNPITWRHEVEDAWNAGVLALFEAGLRPADEPYRCEKYEDGWVGFYRLELADDF